MSALTLADAAVLYATELGWPVFPASLRTKIPCFPTGRDHAEGASREPAVIRRWFEREYPYAAIAAPAGAVSGVVVIDADAKHAGEALLDEIEARLGHLTRALVARTQNGGLHVYLRHPGARIRIKTTAGELGRLVRPGVLAVPGVDVRGDGGIVLLPPSAGYTWEVTGEPAPMLDAWIEATRATAPPVRRRPPALLGQGDAEVKLGEARKVLWTRVRGYRAAARRAGQDQRLLESLAPGGGVLHRKRGNRATWNGGLLERLLCGQALADVGGRDTAVTHVGFLVGLQLPGIGAEAATALAWKALAATPETNGEDLAHWIKKYRRGYERGAERALEDGAA